MNYQLVMRFPKASASAETLRALEIALGQDLAGTAQLDGHDTGARNVDLFIVTADPKSTFRRSKPALERLQLLDRVTAAHRLEGGSRFTVVWPLGYGRRFTLG
jgi:hypothetical protein